MAPAAAQFALVAYIPGTLGAFLNSLRDELVPSCGLLSHVTVLPPRFLQTPKEALTRQMHGRLARLTAFELELGNVEIFPLTSVVFLSVHAGRGAIEEMHDELNRGTLEADEFFDFHPHVTLAQQIPPECVIPLYDLARLRWEQWGPRRSVLVDTLTLVRNDGASGWETVSEHVLPAVNLQKTV